MKYAILAVALVVLCVTAASSSKKNSWEDLLHLTKDGYMASTSREALRELISYINRGDLEAAKDLVRSGQAFFLKPGLKVWIRDSSCLSSIVAIRPYGQRVII